MIKTSIRFFEDIPVRAVWNEETSKWWFCATDVAEALTKSKNPRSYWNAIKRRNPQLSTICRQLKLESSDGKKYKTDCADTEGILRIIQSIPSKKAEPFKRWLAKVGSERIEEIQNPELAMDRMKELYEKKGYSKSWINMRERKHY